MIYDMKQWGTVKITRKDLEIMSLLSHKKALSGMEICRELNLTSAYYNLHKLSALGLLNCVGGYYSLTEEGKEIVNYCQLNDIEVAYLKKEKEKREKRVECSTSVVILYVLNKFKRVCWAHLKQVLVSLGFTMPTIYMTIYRLKKESIITRAEYYELCRLKGCPIRRPNPVYKLAPLGDIEYKERTESLSEKDVKIIEEVLSGFEEEDK